MCNVSFDNANNSYALLTVNTGHQNTRGGVISDLQPDILFSTLNPNAAPFVSFRESLDLMQPNINTKNEHLPMLENIAADPILNDFSIHFDYLSYSIFCYILSMLLYLCLCTPSPTNNGDKDSAMQT